MRLSLGDRSCFIQYDGIHMMCRLQSFSRFNKNAVFGAFSGSDHDCDGCCQTERTGTGDHEDADAKRKRGFKSGAGKHPDGDRDQGDQDDDGNKYTRHLIGQARDRRFA